MLTPAGYRALGLIYDTAVDPGAWRRALDATTEAVEARASALVIRGRRADRPDLTLMSSVYLDFSRTASGVWYGLWLSRLQKADWDLLSRQPVHQPIPDTETGQSVETLDRRADYAFLNKRTRVARRLGFRLNADKVWFDALSMGFEREVTTVPGQAVETARLLLPHLTKAVEMGRVFTLLKSRYRAVLGALDKVQAGLAIAGPDGTIVVYNAETARILDADDGLTRGADGRLVTRTPDLNEELNARIGAACQTARGEAHAAEALLTVPRPSGQAALLIEITPLSDSTAELEPGLDGALITVIDPERTPYLRMDRFTTLYGLTNAEADVCHWIAQGLGVAEIAERRGTTPVTAKNQISAVLAKTGAKNRANLIRLILKVLPPVI